MRSFMKWIEKMFKLLGLTVNSLMKFRKVNECVFGVLALESEAVNPRL